jgi:hypothetical protein
MITQWLASHTDGHTMVGESRCWSHNGWRVTLKISLGSIVQKYVEENIKRLKFFRILLTYFVLKEVRLVNP